MDREQIVRLDKAHVWHPYTAMDEYIAQTDPFVIVRAEGSRLFDADGRAYFDGNSSWYVAGLGHGHPRLRKVLREQAETLAHCSLAGTTHEPAARLAEELVKVAPPGLSRVFYVDNGSTAIEVAVKIAVQAWRQLGKPKKTRLVALEDAYHGDTIGAASLGGVEVFRKPFASVLFDCVRVPSPAQGGHARAFEAVAKILEAESDTIAAVVVEPVVQATAGMQVYDPAYLRELSALCARRDVLFVVDEVFTGYARTGPLWACAHAGITPDVMCIGKAFSAFLPMGATLVTARVFDAFGGAKDRALYYGHTFCGNPLGAALAREVLAIHRDEDVAGQVARKAPRIAKAFERMRGMRGVARVRSIGMIGAADLELEGGSGGYLGQLGWRVFAEARKRGAYVRPLGDTVYVTPPLTMPEGELDELLGIVEASVGAVR